MATRRKKEPIYVYGMKPDMVEGERKKSQGSTTSQARG
jgi:hypothetical protein